MLYANNAIINQNVILYEPTLLQWWKSEITVFPAMIALNYLFKFSYHQNKSWVGQPEINLFWTWKIYHINYIVWGMLTF